MASLYVREKTDGRWRYHRVKTGRGKRTGHIEPPFYARPFFQGKQIWKTLLSSTFEEAQIEANQLAIGLAAEARGLTRVELENSQNSGRVSLKTAVENFISEAQSTKKRKTVLGYRVSLDQFVESTKVKFLDQVTKPVLCSFRDFLQQNGYGVRTQINRIVTVLSLLNQHKIKTEFSIRKDLPRAQQEIASPYSPEELKALFEAMTPEESLRYRFFLGSGCREAEVKYASWADVDFDKKTFHVRAKPDVDFSPKNHQDRVIPLPTSLVEALKARKQDPPHSRWVFVNEKGEPERHFLAKLKRVALRAGLNCGLCRTTRSRGRYQKHQVEVCCKTEPVCEHFYLHRFRKTAATRWHEAGIPVRTIQFWLGHKSLEVTQIYLGVKDSAKLRGEIDKAFGD